MNFSQYQHRVNHHLSIHLDSLDVHHQLIQAMHYATLIGGKRIRPVLTYLTGEMLGCQLSDIDTAACAIECIHTYSLIHDDLPAMDDDSLRRNQPTCHIKYDEATAILAGDALQTLAFSILASGPLSEQGDSQRLAMIKRLTHASGATGMCLGQSLDLAAENRTIDLAELEFIHQKKTGELIQCAVELGALCAGEKGQQILPSLSAYAAAIGLAFQVQDDILDIIGDTEVIGKQRGSDVENQKSTYPTLIGLDASQKLVLDLRSQAHDALSCISYDTQPLHHFADYIVSRHH